MELKQKERAASEKCKALEQDIESLSVELILTNLLTESTAIVGFHCKYSFSTRIPEQLTF